MRNGFIRRFFCFSLALCMLIGIGASAEIVQYDVTLNSVLGALNGSITIYDDDDGCVGLLLKEDTYGELLIQTGESIVIGNDKIGYSEITDEALDSAMQILSIALENDLSLEESIRQFNYLNSAAYYEDMAALEQMMPYITNIIAQTAMMNNILILHEDGTLEIKASLEDIRILLDTIVAKIQSDEYLLNTFTGLHLWEVSGEDPHQLLQSVSSATQALTLFGMDIADASLYFMMTAQGSLNADFNAKEKETNRLLNVSLFSDVSGLGLKVANTDGADEKAFELFIVDEELQINAYRRGVEHNTYSLNIVQDIVYYALSAKGEMDMNGKTGSFTFDSNLANTAFDGSMKSEAMELVVQYTEKPFDGVVDAFVSVLRGDEYEEYSLNTADGALSTLSYLYQIAGAAETQFSLLANEAGGFTANALWGGADGKAFDMTLLAGDTLQIDGVFENKGGQYPFVRPFALYTDELGNLVFAYTSDGKEAYQDQLTVVLTEKENSTVGTIQYSCEKDVCGVSETITLNGKISMNEADLAMNAVLEKQAGDAAPDRYTLTYTGDSSVGEYVLVEQSGGITRTCTSIVRIEDESMYLEGSLVQPDMPDTKFELVLNPEDGTFKLAAALPALGMSEYVVEATQDSVSYYAEDKTGAVIMDIEIVRTVNDHENIICVSGTILDTPITETIGIEQEENTLRAFIEYDVNGEKTAVELPITIVTLGNGAAISAKLRLLSAGEQIDCASIKISGLNGENDSRFTAVVDIFDENGEAVRYLDLSTVTTIYSNLKEHISGEEMAAEELAEILYNALIPYMN